MVLEILLNLSSHFWCCFCSFDGIESIVHLPVFHSEIPFFVRVVRKFLTIQIGIIVSFIYCQVHCSLVLQTVSNLSKWHFFPYDWGKIKLIGKFAKLVCNSAGDRINTKSTTKIWNKMKWNSISYKCLNLETEMYFIYWHDSLLFHTVFVLILRKSISIIVNIENRLIQNKKK